MKFLVKFLPITCFLYFITLKAAVTQFDNRDTETQIYEDNYWHLFEGIFNTCHKIDKNPFLSGKDKADWYLNQNIDSDLIDKMNFRQEDLYVILAQIAFF